MALGHLSRRSSLLSNVFSIFFVALFFLVSVAVADDGSAEEVDPVQEMAQGDKFLAKGESSSALKAYTRAVQADPKNTLPLTKRSAAHIHRKEFGKAVRDLSEAIAVDPSFTQAYLERGKLRTKLCSFEDAKTDLEEAMKDPKSAGEAQKEIKSATRGPNLMAQMERMMASMVESGKPNNGLTTVTNEILKMAPHCVEAKLANIQLRMLARDYGTVLTECANILKVDGGNMQALLLRGNAYLETGDTEQALSHYREGLKFDPEHDAIKKQYRKVKNYDKAVKKAGETFKKGKFHEAAKDYQKAIEMFPSMPANAKLHMQLCTVNTKIKRYPTAIKECSKAIQYDAQMMSAYKQRARIYVQQEEWEKAKEDVDQAKTIDPQDHELRQLEHEVMQAQKLASRKDYYKILGVDKNADEKTIKKAYKKLAIQYHPDKNPDNPEEAQKKFAEVADAQDVLLDPEKRARYDRGEDIEGGGGPGGPGGDPFGGFGGFHFQQGGGFGGFNQGGQRFHFRQG
mmetsp:Transcript_2600/g.2866  ORF Transcript_2600/g.2866 Transcript_2600/m.2866 type:complete len:513 (-) Transcript_2600:220-1758(-)|eukprot:CAMPEP_0197855278 /NCGR_PEP_ID=MMETSP1438-20131217/26306_1 /TAXON_ID=1461541 /ORGANISM="Pterosperma sp., Strain CCMP1384" /LENGTH=512 /DNA_ID=CAMNT_0043470323 /DNA_START=198 /DNA_END=1736 /DNA_ORIENTATION=+